LVTTELVEPVSISRSTGHPLFFIWTIGSWGPNRIEPGLS
jgi:hypothetical protein